MANTVVIESLSGTGVPTSCIVMVKAHAEVDGVPVLDGGTVLLFDNGLFLSVSPTVRDEDGNFWFRFFLSNGVHAIRAAINDGFTPISNTVTITWGVGSICPPTVAAAVVLTAEATPASVRLTWTPYVAPHPDFPPLLGWRIARSDGAIDYLPPEALAYNDWGQGLFSLGVPLGTPLSYTVTPYLGGSGITTVSNTATATVPGRDGVSLEQLRYRIA